MNNSHIAIVSTNLATISRRIAEIQAQIVPLASTLEKLNREKGDAESRLYIAVNNIRKDDVQLSSGLDVPYFGDIYTFGAWLSKTKCAKNWVEWNGRVYRTTDLMVGKMPDSPACMRDLE